MRRREFLAAIGAYAGICRSSVAALGQAPKPKVGWFGGTTEDAAQTNLHAFLAGLRDFGYEDGRNIELVYRWSGGNYGKFPAIAAELLALNPNLLIAATISGVAAVRKLSATIPVVDPLLIDPVKLGFADAFNRPAQNVTGLLMTLDTLIAKQVELLLEVAPHIKALGVLRNERGISTINAMYAQSIQSAIGNRPIKIIELNVRTVEGLEPVFQRARHEGIDGLFVSHDPLLMAGMHQIIAFANSERVPAIYSFRVDVENGGLLGYAVDIPQNFRRSAYFVDRILKGSKPGDLPIEVPAKLELAINLKTARALGIEIPPKLLFTADAVFE